MRSMNSAVTGLRNHQTYMDVVGNNIANVNTTGFRASRVAFQDILSQTMRQASAPTATRGGINAQQVGLGATIGSIDTIQTAGNLQTTDRPTDLALEGDGFFVVSDGTRSYYTRDGAFDRSIDGSLVNSSGLKVMGWQATNGVVDTTKALSPLNIPLGKGMRAVPSTKLEINGNVDPATAIGDSVEAQGTVIDSLGVSHDIAVTFTRTGPNAWTWLATPPPPGSGVTVTPGTATPIAFAKDGQVILPDPPPTVTVIGANGANPTVMTVNFASLSQLSGASDLQVAADGSEAGYLTSFSVDENGMVSGVYSNGATEPIGQIAVAAFANPGGLTKAGGNVFEVSASSGQPQVGAPGINGRGKVRSGALEMSNVDLAQQFTNMIQAERGFQANSRVITASDQILQDLVNLVR